MKTAILSMQRVVNYGSVLQAYSLREMVCQAAGEMPDFLDIQDEPSLPVRRSIQETDADYAAPVSNRLLQRGKRWIIRKLSARTKKHIRAFMRDELHLSANNNSKQYDAVIVGSDEVFNHAKGLRLQLHGEIPQADRLITYAASCGSALAEDIAEHDLPRVRSAMRRFSAVSVRDAGTAAYAARLGVTVTERHLDPVLVGPLRERKAKPVWLRRYLLVYAYGQRIHTPQEIHAIRTFARENGLKTVAMGGSQYWCDLYVPASPMRMLDWFAHADYVVTDTFHGTIFSVLHHRPFAVITRRTNENKLMSLLEDLGLAQQRLADMSQLPRVLTQEIRYAQVDAILDRERCRTHEFLKEQLHDGEGAHQSGQ